MLFNTGSSNPGLDWKLRSMPVLDIKSATEKIKENEVSYTFDAEDTGQVSRVDTVQVASNSPIEDYMASGEIDVGKGGTWHCWAIYDGHVGQHTAIILAHSLIPYVERSLRAYFDGPTAQESIQDCIIAAFSALDGEILADGLAALGDAQSHAEVQARLAPCYAGSCALLALYNPGESMLYVANTGDFRAVLGVPQDAGWGTLSLSKDHTPSNPTEAERVQTLHPDQKNLITKRDGDCARYVGIAVTRAFGDARWKWSKDTLKRCEKEFSGKPAPGNVVNPPYLEATPEVVSYKLRGGEFLILASDGLWNHLSSDGAVEAIEKWTKIIKTNSLSEIGSGIPVAVGGGAALVDIAEGISFWEHWKVRPEWFVYEDDNAATHLVKNAFGGRQRQLFTGVMTVDTPVSKTMRDDVTVQVVFFDSV